MFKPPTLVSIDVVGVTIAKIGLIVVSIGHGYVPLVTSRQFQNYSHAAGENHDLSRI